MPILFIPVILALIPIVASVEVCSSGEAECRAVFINGLNNSRTIDKDLGDPAFELVTDRFQTTDSIRCVLIDENSTEIKFGALTTELAARLRCELNGRDYDSKDEVFVASFSRYVYHSYDSDFQFVTSASEGNKKLIVTFALPIPPNLFTQNSAFCLIDNNTNIETDAVYQDSNSLICDLSLLELSDGLHQLYAIRALELLNSTLLHQSPIPVTIQVEDANDELKENGQNGPAVALKTRSPLRFNNQLTGVQLQLPKESLAGCPSSVPCDMFFGDVLHFERCLIVDSTVTAIILPNTIKPLNNTTRVRFPTAADQCRITPAELSRQEFVEIKIGSAENAIAPIGHINQNKAASSIELSFVENFGCGYQHCACQWTIIKSELASLFMQLDGCVIHLNTSKLPVRIQLEACNFAGKCTVIPHKLYNDLSNTFDLQIVGVPEQVFADQTLTLYPRITFLDKPNNNLKYIWYVNQTIVSRLGSLIIKSNTYRAGQSVTVLLDVQQFVDNSSYGAMAMQKIQFAYYPIKILTSSQERSINVDEELVIDASECYDPNNSSATLHHNWLCTDITTRTSCDVLIRSQSACLVVPANLLTESHRYLFSDTITTVNNVKSTVKVQVNVNSPNLPVIQIVSTRALTMTASDHLKAKALVTPNDSFLRLSWTVFDKLTNLTIVDAGNTPKSAHLYQNIQRNKTITTSLTLAPGSVALLAGQVYVVKLTAINKFGSSWSDFDLNVTPALKNARLIVTPLDQLLALQTPAQFTLLLPQAPSKLKIRFGLHALLVTNETIERWFPATLSTKHHVFLPSTINQTNANCLSRLGFKAFAEICQNNQVCVTVHSSEFTVQQVSSTVEATTQLTQLINYDLQMGLPFEAYEKFDALQQETCVRNAELCDSIVSELVGQLKPTSGIDRLISGIHYLSNVFAKGACSPQMLPDLLNAIETARSLILHSKNESRQKRSIDLVSAMSSGTESVVTESVVSRLLNLHHAPSATLTMWTGRLIVHASLEMPPCLKNCFEASRYSDLSRLRCVILDFYIENNNHTEANTLLVAYDLLVSKNQNVVSVYLSNLIDLMSGFCVQIDSTRTMSASGQNFTTIQLQGLIPSYKSFLTTKYSLAGTTEKTIIFNKNFQKSYETWACLDKVNCSEICLGSAQVKFSVLQSNDYMASHFTTSRFNTVGLNQLVSDLYEVVFMNPITGKQMSLAANVSFTIRIPLLSYRPSFYYKCYIFTSSTWISDLCQSANYGISLNSGTTGLECTCNSGGFVGIFTVPAPNPISYPQYNEVEITMKLATTSECLPDNAKAFVLALSQATNLEKSRFVRTTCQPGGWLSTALRPAFCQNQTSNSFAMQSIKKALLAPGGFTAYDTVTVVNLTDSVVYRNLTNDGNARRITLRINRSYKEVVGNDSTLLTQSWVSSMATNMRLSPYRFKNPVLAMGIIYNFTITVSFTGENNEESKLSAEEIAEWIREQSVYSELDLQDSQNERIPIEEINADADIVELVVVTRTTPLMIVSAAVVTAICVLASFCVGGVVFIKIRTDRLIEKHNKNRQLMAISHSVPMTILPIKT